MIPIELPTKQNATHEHERVATLRVPHHPNSTRYININIVLHHIPKQDIQHAQRYAVDNILSISIHSASPMRTFHPFRSTLCTQNTRELSEPHFET